MSVPELDDLSVGARIRALRERRGMSRAVLAGLVGKDPEWLKRIETGTRGEPRLTMVAKIAEALQLTDITLLIGDVAGGTISLPTLAGGRAGHDAVPGVRAAIEGHALTFPTMQEPPDVAGLHQRVSDAWHVWHTSDRPRAVVGSVLPRLIVECRSAVRVLDGHDRRRAAAALASAYALAELLLAWVADGPLLWLAADRCMAAAEQADDPDVLALGAWIVGNVWRASDRLDDALGLATDAASLLEPRLDDSERSRALYGAARLHAAITAAKMGHDGEAQGHLDDALRMADRMPDGYAEPITVFGRPNAAITAVTVEVELMRGGQAIDIADRVDPDSLPSVDRRARMWLETARGFDQRRDHTAALHVLRKATSISTEAMQCHPLARTLAARLATSGGALVRSEARELARDLGVVTV